LTTATPFACPPAAIWSVPPLTVKCPAAVVSRGAVPPDAPVALNLSLTDMSLVGAMPACRFPAYPRYVGSGDPRQAASFQCTPRPEFVLPQLH